MTKPNKPHTSEPVEVVLHDVPFYTQQAKPDDGFTSSKDAEHWQIRGCGIASLRMVVAALTNRTQPQKTYAQLITEGVEQGAYLKGVGWIHASIAKMVESYGLSAQAKREATSETVAADIENGWLTIVSVTRCYQGGTPDPETGKIRTPGGHLIVAYGTRRNPNQELSQLICHHPSAVEKYNWPNNYVDIERFNASFSGHYIQIGPTAE